jgi:hypothetical protein
MRMQIRSLGVKEEATGKRKLRPLVYKWKQ